MRLRERDPGDPGDDVADHLPQGVVARSGSPNGPPIVAGGLVWALDWNGATLYAMNPSRGTPSSAGRRMLEHFATPAVGDAMVFVPTAEGVEAFRTAR